MEDLFPFSAQKVCTLLRLIHTNNTPLPVNCLLINLIVGWLTI